MGAQILYSHLPLSKNRDKQVDKLKRLGIRYLGSQDLGISFDPIVFQKSADIVDSIFYGIQSGTIHELVKGKIGANNYDKSYDITIRRKIYAYIQPFVEISESVRRYDEVYGVCPTIICERNKTTDRVFEHYELKNSESLVISYLIQLITLASKGFLNIRRLTVPVVNNLFGNKSAVAQESCSSPKTPTSKSRVVYFPHKGIDYGNSEFTAFLKDHYYIHEPGNPLAPNNILHLGIKDSDSELKYSYEYYKKMGITHRDYFSYKGISKIDVAKLIFWFIARCVGQHGNLPFDPTILLIYLGLLLDVLTHRARLRRMSAKYVLVGYDHLFPINIALACRLERVITLATQERHVCAWMQPFYIFDYYFAIGKPVVTELSQSHNCSIRNFFSIGSIRKDLVVKELECRHEPIPSALNKYERTVLVLDFQTEKSTYENMGRQPNTIEFNRRFYKVILDTSRYYPKLLFQIKGLNTDFLDIPQYADIVFEINKTENLEVITDLQYWTPARVAATADFAIVLHTSLMDEMLQVGKPVILFDPPYLNEPSGHTDVYDSIIVRDTTGLWNSIDEILLGNVLRYEKISKTLYSSIGCSSRNQLHQKLRQIVGLTADG